MSDNHQNLINKVKVIAHPAAEFLSAIYLISEEENFIKKWEDELNFVPASDFLTKFDYINSNASRYLKRESKFFFEKGGGIGYAIWAKLIADNPDIQSVEGILNKLNDIEPSTLIHYVMATSSKKYSQNTEEIYKEIEESKLLEDSIREKLLELIENPIEVKERFHLVMSQFYHKCYKNIEKNLLKDLEIHRLNVEKKLAENPTQFFKKHFRMNLGEQTQNINIHTSFFRQLGSSYMEQNNETWILMGYNSDYYNEEKLSKDKMLKFFKTVSDKKRLEILMLLSQRPWYVNELGEELNLTAPTISYHMNMLMEQDIVYFERDEHRLYYSLNKDKVKDLFEEGMTLILDL